MNGVDLATCRRGKHPNWSTPYVDEARIESFPVIKSKLDLEKGTKYERDVKYTSLSPAELVEMFPVKRCHDLRFRQVAGPDESNAWQFDGSVLGRRLTSVRPYRTR